MRYELLEDIIIGIVFMLPVTYIILEDFLAVLRDDKERKEQQHRLKKEPKL